MWLKGYTQKIDNQLYSIITEVDTHCARHSTQAATFCNRVFENTYALRNVRRISIRLDVSTLKLQEFMPAVEAGGGQSMPKALIPPRIRFVLTVPTSANNLHEATKTGGKPVTDEYRAWKAQAGMQILAQRTPYSVDIAVPRAEAGDIDNQAKATMVLLKTMDVTSDDKYLDNLHMWRSLTLPKGEVHVTAYTVQIDG